jgi:leader peptidase (prepilin peptidase)/N-methyltransferase
MSSLLLFELGALMLGLLLGSFLNVCIARLPEHRSINKPRSHCANCQQIIRWYDNVPLLSWILLRARCRHCKAPISWRYPAVEFAVGIWFVLIVNGFNAVLYKSHQPTLSPGQLIASFGVAVLGFLLIGLLVMDWQTHRLPDAFTLTGIAIGFVLVCCQAVFLGPHDGEVILKGRNPLTSPGNVVDRGNVILTGPEHLVLGRLWAIVAAACLLLLIRLLYQKLRGREGMGLGDVKLLAMITAFLGFWPAILALLLGVLLCSAYALTLLTRGRSTAATRLPLGSFLSLGGLIAAVFGPSLIAWYSSLL